MNKTKLSLMTVLLALVAVACRGGNVDTASVSIDATVSEPTVGDTMLNVNIIDGNGNPVNDAKLSIKGDMTHAGMEPVLRESTSGTDGNYMIPFEFTMGGDWIVTIEAELADGSAASRDFDFSVSSDMAEMDHDEDDAEHGDHGEDDTEHGDHGDEDAEHSDHG